MGYLSWHPSLEPLCIKKFPFEIQSCVNSCMEPCSEFLRIYSGGGIFRQKFTKWKKSQKETRSNFICKPLNRKVATSFENSLGNGTYLYKCFSCISLLFAFELLKGQFTGSLISSRIRATKGQTKLFKKEFIQYAWQNVNKALSGLAKANSNIWLFKNKSCQVIHFHNKKKKVYNF